MNKYIIGKHFINSEETFQEFEKWRAELDVAMKISQKKKIGFEFGLKITVDEPKISDSLKEKINSAMAHLPHGLIVMYDPRDRGAGISYRQIMFNPTFDNGIVVGADCDQFPLGSEDSLESIAELVERVETEEALFANGSRNVPVVLAKHQSNTDARIIQELFHSLAIGSDRLQVGKKMPNVTPAYAAIGEITTGLYILNHAHPKYPELCRAVMEAANVADLKGFVTDFYVSLKASQLGKISRGYVSAAENVVYGTKTETEERDSIVKYISTIARELGKTDVREMLVHALSSETNVANISRFYKRKEVERVRDIMLEAATKK